MFNREMLSFLKAQFPKDHCRFGFLVPADQDIRNEEIGPRTVGGPAAVQKAQQDPKACKAAGIKKAASHSWYKPLRIIYKMKCCPDLKIGEKSAPKIPLHTALRGLMLQWCRDRKIDGNIRHSKQEIADDLVADDH